MAPFCMLWSLKRGVRAVHGRLARPLPTTSPHSQRARQSQSRVLSFFSSRRNWDSLNPSPAAAGECVPIPPVPGGGGRGTLAGERGVGRVPIPTRDIHYVILYIYLLVPPVLRGRYVLRLDSGMAPVMRLFAEDKQRRHNAFNRAKSIGGFIEDQAIMLSYVGSFPNPSRRRNTARET